jgi:DNA (cytosine-5)-methyltransferase 1
MSRPRLLDLFCGAGGCSVGYHRAGFEVVGVDIRPQKNYPFEFHQADAMTFPLEGFDAIDASPPCQRYSITRRMHNDGEDHPDLVAATRHRLIASGVPWIIENVVGSPLFNATTLCGLMFGLKVLRHRLFETSFMVMTPPHPKHPSGNLTNASRGYNTGESGFVCVAGHNFVREAGAQAMGIDWPMTRPELAQAIPPAYTEFIGGFLMEEIIRRQIHER